MATLRLESSILGGGDVTADLENKNNNTANLPGTPSKRKGDAAAAYKVIRNVYTCKHLAHRCIQAMQEGCFTRSKSYDAVNKAQSSDAQQAALKKSSAAKNVEKK
jgi:hypothetical protein